jgi:hypothetical protein
VIGLPLAQLLLRIQKDLLGRTFMLVFGPVGAGDDGGIVEQIEETTSVFGENGLLIGTFDDGVDLHRIRFLQLLPGDVGQLGLGDEVLGFRADEFLFEGEDLGGCGILVFQMSYLIGDLGLVFAGRINRGFGIANLLEDLTRSLEGAGIVILDFADFATGVREMGASGALLPQEDTELVGNVRDRFVICLFSPQGELSSDTLLLLGGRFVCLSLDGPKKLAKIPQSRHFQS